MIIRILHEKQFNQSKLSVVAQYLQALPHYYTNMNAKSSGLICDKLHLFDKVIFRAI
jgi:hypothetical protein